MQSVSSLSFEAIPFRFCEKGGTPQDYEEISLPSSGNFSYFQGLSAAFSNPGCFIRRQHVNAIGRVGTTAQAIVQSGGGIGFTHGVSYGKFAAISLFNGVSESVWVSDQDGNSVPPPGFAAYYTVMGSAEVEDGLPSGAMGWHLASAAIGKSFFDES
ncbi:MAG: hypothetical protein J6V72_20975 [Kiritimatiellae bacterium]|nr:hypothetical protein [Kiritimatiellia bacterium]